MRIKAAGLAGLLAAVLVAATWAIVAWGLSTQASNDIQSGTAATAKQIPSRAVTEAQAPEITTVVIPSQPNPSRRHAVPSVVGPELVRQVQHELKRLGCYTHEINAEWTPATRRAMRDFLDRANAVLPLGAPETVHLALLKGQTEPVCGSTCPAGQTLTKGDQCLPSALIASGTKYAAGPGISSQGSETTVADASAPPAPSSVRVVRARAPSPPNYSSGFFFGLFGF